VRGSDGLENRPDLPMSGRCALSRPRRGPVVFVVSPVLLGLVQVVATDHVPSLPDQPSDPPEGCLHGFHTSLLSHPVLERYEV
jgi:hypothetical protein